jgi:predicted DNA-binding transcriptional regulator AlpA
MNLEQTQPKLRTRGAAPPHSVVLSRWVNERYPDREQLLSAHDVARLTRRPRWWLLSMMLIGRFPRKRRFHGRGIGWLRSDVVGWLAEDSPTFQYARPARVVRSRRSCQMALPLDCAQARARRRRRARFPGNLGGGNGSAPVGGRR